MVVLQPIVHTELMNGVYDGRPGPRGSAPTPRAGTEIGDGRLTLVNSRPLGHGEVPPPQETARARSRRRRSLSRLSNATLIGLACAGSIGAVGAVNASLFPSLGHPTSESVWQNPGKVPASAAAATTPSPRAERVVVVDPTFALVVGVGPAGGSAGAAIESTSTEPAPPSTLDAIGAAQPSAPRAVASGSSGSGSGSGSGSVQGITTSIVPTSSSPTVDSPDHVTPSTPGTTDDHGVVGPDTTTDTTPSPTDDSTPSDTTDPASGGTPSGSGGSGRDGSGSGKGGKGG